MPNKADDRVKKLVRESYAEIARQNGSGCSSSCCGGSDRAKTISKEVGYTDADLQAVPEGANLGLGCGNPLALAALQKGETVLDLGSGAGFDCFLAADRVGDSGHVIGVDMTPEMIEKARENARKGDYPNVEFRLGEIENLPVADSSVDMVISNCVINLSPDKGRVFREALRVLKPGGRLMISDMVLLHELPDWLRSSGVAYVGCLSGAMLQDRYLEAIRAAGFQQIRVVDETSFPLEYLTSDPVARELVKNSGIPATELKDIAKSVLSVKVSGVKPQ